MKTLRWLMVLAAAGFSAPIIYVAGAHFDAYVQIERIFWAVDHCPDFEERHGIRHTREPYWWWPR